MKELNIKIISGLSGAGKSKVLDVLEDRGYFCIDNFLPFMLENFIDGIKDTEGMKNIALVFDIRGGYFLKDMGKAINYLKDKKIKYQIIFLDSKEEVLVNRFKNTRRIHPLSLEEPDCLIEAIREERKSMESLKEMATLVIDTSNLNEKMLAKTINNYLNSTEKNKFIISLISFGYKYGIPLDSDLVFDVRFIENPYYDKSMKHLTGLDETVFDFVSSRDVTKVFIEKYTTLIQSLLEDYKKQDKKQLTISIGCTGGQHRSVSIVRMLAKELLTDDIYLNVHHREIKRF